jgi:hypothetical protein
MFGPMKLVRHAAAGVFALAAITLGVAACVVLAVDGADVVACVYGAVAVGFVQLARRLRPRRRFVFARR